MDLTLPPDSPSVESVILKNMDPARVVLSRAELEAIRWDGKEETRRRILSWSWEKVDPSFLLEGWWVVKIPNPVQITKGIFLTMKEEDFQNIFLITAKTNPI